MADSKKTIKLFLMDSEPTGRIKCSVDGTTCIAFKVNREDLDKCKDRKELKQTGVYFLFGGTTDESVKEVVYIGQANRRKNGEGLLCRLKEHKEDYWNEAVAITTTDNSFGPTEISYLENHFSNLAKEANRYVVKNGNEPMPGNISEEKQCALEEFVQNTNLILSVLNYKVFIPIVETKQGQNNSNCKENMFYLERKIRNIGITIEAKGQKTRDGFVVLKGSYIAKDDMKNIYPKVKKLRQAAKIDENRILQEDILLTSPTYAAAFVIGGNTNGLVDWKTKDGTPLKNMIE